MLLLLGRNLLPVFAGPYLGNCILVGTDVRLLPCADEELQVVPSAITLPVISVCHWMWPWLQEICRGGHDWKNLGIFLLEIWTLECWTQDALEIPQDLMLLPTVVAMSLLVLLSVVKKKCGRQ